MKPVFSVNLLNFNYSFSSYSFFMTVGALAVILISLFYVKKIRLPIIKSAIFLLLTALSVPIGGRILNVLINYNSYMMDTEKIFTLKMTGFSLMGGLLLASLVGYLLCRAFMISPWKMADAVAPGLGAGLAFMRLGCYFNGCCFGLRTFLPWAVKFPFESPAHKHYFAINDNMSVFSLGNLFASPGVHPTQLYELTGSMIAAIIAAYIISKGVKPGIAALSGALVFSSTRLINHFLRVHPSTNQINPLFYPSLYIILIIILIITFNRRLHSGPQRR